MRLVVVWLCVLGTLVGCATEPRRSPDPLPVPDVPVAAVAPNGGEHDAAVARWHDFPAERMPRPLVFEHPEQDAALVAPDGLPAELPAAPPTVTVALPDGSVEMPLATPAIALAAMRTATGARPVSANPLRPVTRVVLSSERVHLDRGGEVALPMWHFYVGQGAAPLSWPAAVPEAVAPWSRAGLARPDNTGLDAAWWSVPGTDPSVIAVVLRQPRRPCSDQPTYRHEPRVTETPSAVVVGLAQVRVDLAVPAGVPCDQSLAWGGEQHLVRLAAPLGGRVVVDDTGAPIPVMPRP